MKLQVNIDGDAGEYANLIPKERKSKKYGSVGIEPQILQL